MDMLKAIVIANDLLFDGRIGDFFRGELGSPGCDNNEEWIAIATAIRNRIDEGIGIVSKREQQGEK